MIFMRQIKIRKKKEEIWFEQQQQQQQQVISFDLCVYLLHIDMLSRIDIEKIIFFFFVHKLKINEFFGHFNRFTKYEKKTSKQAKKKKTKNNRQER